MTIRRPPKGRVGPAGRRRPDSAASAGATPAATRVKLARPGAPKPKTGAADTAADSGKVRLSKLMSERGLCSRREADALIERGLVLVDGERVTLLGTKVDPSQTVTLDKRAEKQQSQLATILLNKPVGYVSSQPEKGYKAAVTLIGKEYPLPGRPRPAALLPRTPARAGSGGAARHRFHRASGADARRPHRQAADRRRFRNREGIPGAGGRAG